jgi:predicted GTPase
VRTKHKNQLPITPHSEHEMTQKQIIIMGAAGRDFHNFNMVYRDNRDYRVVCFTATQIPDIAGRCYPPELAGHLYPQGIPIYPEEQLPALIKKNNVDEVIFAYSDVPYTHVMQKSALVNAMGANFCLLGPESTMLKSHKPVIAVCAIRTGCGKSQVSRKIFHMLSDTQKVVAIRHPMPYGDLAKQACQRFASRKDLDDHECTIEEREEYEPYIEMGGVVYAGVDYDMILKKAEEEADIIIWDGGNNDFSFIKPDILITLTDPHRVGHEQSYYAGEVNLRMADIVIINKVGTAPLENIQTLQKTIAHINPSARVLQSHSPLEMESVTGKQVLVVEDGPTLTHGGMSYGAGTLAAQKNNLSLVDPRPYAVGSIKETYQKYPHITTLLPAMGYSKKQIQEMEETINAIDCDAIVSATPIDLGRLVSVDKPIVRVRYKMEEQAAQDLKRLIDEML